MYYVDAHAANERLWRILLKKSLLRRGKSFDSRPFVIRERSDDDGRQSAPARLFYDFDLDRHVPPDHLLREIDRFLDMDGMRSQLRPFYRHLGRPSIDPELIVRMLVLGYVMGIRSERRLCDEVHLNLAYRWFCGLGLEGKVPDHSTFSKYRHGKFRDSGLLRSIFETTVERCLKEDLVSGDGFAVDASLIAADANKCRSLAADDWSPEVAREIG